MEETGNEICTPCTPVSAARSMSCGKALHQARHLKEKPAPTNVLMFSFSFVDMAGVPISTSGTAALWSKPAIFSFSSNENTTPAACSPSRSVVSIICAWGGFILKSGIFRKPLLLRVHRGSRLLLLLFLRSRTRSCSDEQR